MKATVRAWLAGGLLVAASVAAAVAGAAPPLPCRLVAVFPAAEVPEPSGLCYHAGRGTLFVVGDGGDVWEYATNGAPVGGRRILSADLEGIATDPASGLLYAAVEGQERILEIDPDGLAVTRTFAIERSFEGRELLKAGGSGLEGIEFLPVPAHPEGGYFVVANQGGKVDAPEDPPVLAEIELPLRSGARSDSERPVATPRSGGAGSAPEARVAIRRAWSLGVEDPAALAYDAARGVLLVASDRRDLLLEVDPASGAVAARHALPGRDQEGLALDADGFLYIAQDSGGILKLQRQIDREKKEGP